jgi:hypothetical protein
MVLNIDVICDKFNFSIIISGVVAQGDSCIAAIFLFVSFEARQLLRLFALCIIQVT